MMQLVSSVSFSSMNRSVCRASDTAPSRHPAGLSVGGGTFRPAGDRPPAGAAVDEQARGAPRGAEPGRRVDVKAPHADRASSQRDTQAQAEQRAKEILSNLGGGEAVIPTTKGVIRDKDTVAP